jgi:hypothetical protein
MGVLYSLVDMAHGVNRIFIRDIVHETTEKAMPHVGARCDMIC